MWLWAAVFAGPVAWLTNVSVNSALAPVACAHRSMALLNLVAALAFAATVAGWVISWFALRQSPEAAAKANDEATEDDSSHGRRRFMALLGLGVALLFAVQIVAGAFPQWVLDACD